MKRVRVFSIYSLLLIILASSCSISKDVSNGSFIQKRKYNKGFFVNKDKSKNRTINSTFIAQNQSSNKDKSITDNNNNNNNNNNNAKPEVEIENTINNKELIASKEQNIYSSVVKNNTPLKIKYLKGNKFIKAKKVLKNIDVNPDDGKLKYHWTTIVGFIFSVLFFIPYLIIPALILGVIGLNRIEKYPELYKGIKLAKAGLIILFVWIITVLVFLAFYIGLVALLFTI